MLPSPSDTRASLIVRLRDQEDRDAWDEVLAIYGPLVFRMAMRQGLQRADAEDVVQQVFTAIFQSVEKWLEQSEARPVPQLAHWYWTKRGSQYAQSKAQGRDRRRRNRRTRYA
jgi:hypothetical protein